jgi:hypothetical protein
MKLDDVYDCSTENAERKKYHFRRVVIICMPTGASPLNHVKRKPQTGASRSILKQKVTIEKSPHVC